MPRRSHNREKILDLAEFYIQTRGFNAFSYKNLANEIGIKTASVHYYFPSKTDLAIALVSRYSQSFFEFLKEVEHTETSTRERLKALAGKYAEVLNDRGRFCLCAMMATDMTTLSDEVAAAVTTFFTDVQAWIESQLAREEGPQPDQAQRSSAAAHFFSTLVGAMLVGRTIHQPESFQRTIDHALQQVLPKP